MIKKILLGILIISFSMLFIYSVFIEPNKLLLKKYQVEDSELKGLKVVFASDFHFNPYQKNRLKKVVSLINEQNPDIVFYGGDFVSGHFKFLSMPIEKISKGLGSVNSKYGVYTCLGNHDKWYNVDKIRIPIENAGIKVLNDEFDVLNVNNKRIYIVGLEYKSKNKSLQKQIFQKVNSPLIILSHSPDEFVDLSEKFNIMFSGHTHGGQIRFPIIGPILTFSKYFNKYAYGFFIENSKKMLVSSGVGYSLLPIRFNCLPEIVVVEFM